MLFRFGFVFFLKKNFLCYKVAKLTALEEFKSQKEELLSKLDQLQEQIDFLELDHKNKVNEIEKKVIIDKDR